MKKLKRIFLTLNDPKKLMYIYLVQKMLFTCFYGEGGEVFGTRIN